MSKQTAVEWFAEQVEQYILTHGNLPLNVLSNFKEQANAMFEEQMRVTYNQGLMSNFQNFEQYYNDTYKGGEQ